MTTSDEGETFELDDELSGTWCGPEPELDDAAKALAEACGWTYICNYDDVQTAQMEGALAFAQQLQTVMSDIAAEFGDDPMNAAATTVFALAGMVSDVHAIAYAAELYDGDIPPHPHRSHHMQLPVNPNRQQRRQMQREVERMRKRFAASPFQLPTTND